MKKMSAYCDHDNDPSHKSKSDMEWLQKMMISMFENAPELNSIKKLWNDMKNAVLGRSPSNFIALEHVSKEEWNKIGN